MKSLIVVLFLALCLFGEMGDCLTCHPKLLKDIDKDSNHSPMQSCIECHTKNKTDTPECGDRCFSCHSQSDLEPQEIEQHRVIQKCRECHVDAINNIFDTSNSFDQSKQESLKDFLIN